MNESKLTSLARPISVYLCIFMVFLNYSIIPLVCRFLGKDSSPLSLTPEFFYGFFAIAGVYAIGRSVEKITQIKNDTSTTKEE